MKVKELIKEVEKRRTDIERWVREDLYRDSGDVEVGIELIRNYVNLYYAEVEVKE